MSKTYRILIAAILAGGISIPASILAQPRDGGRTSTDARPDDDAKDKPGRETAPAQSGRSNNSPASARKADEKDDDEDGRRASIFGPTEPSGATTRIVRWVKETRDNGSMPFIIIDKKEATVFVYDSKGTLLGDTPALIGIANGDDSTPGVGAKTLAELGPAEKTTPAGRFVARIGPASTGQKVLWVDYDTSVALHAVVTGNKRERRLERLLSPSIDDNRITYGCINVPTHFYNQQVEPVFEKTGGIVYVLPDAKSLESVFPKLRAPRIAMQRVSL